MTSEIPKAAQEPQNSIKNADLALLFAIPAIAWASFIRKMATDWSTNAQYEFGYFVPFFIAYLLMRRWVSRPLPAASGRKAILWSGISILLLLLPMRIISEANPDWRPFNWVQATLLVALSLAAIGVAGGRPWVWYFFAPFLLIFFALPWPLAFEQAVLQGLSRVVTAVTVEILNLINIPALQRGNVIDIATGSVGVADACSGIRSLAGTLMASFFFGEFYRLAPTKRIALLCLASIISFSLNLVRAFFLSWRAAAEGIQSIDRWHDPAGFIIFVISFISLWLLASAIARTESSADSDSLTRPTVLNAILGRRALIVCLLWTVGTEVASEVWYRTHEGKRPSPIAWDFSWPGQGEQFEFTPISEETRSILRYTSGKAGTFKWNDGTTWQVFFFRWAPGRSSVQLATMHRPEICLPAVGYKFLSEASPVQISLPFGPLNLTGSVFEAGGNNVYVYRCLWEDFQRADLIRNREFDMSVKGRLLSSWYGRRNLGQRLLQVAIVGMPDEESAHAQLYRRLTELIAQKG